MLTISKDVIAVFRKIFRSSDKIMEQGRTGGDPPGSPSPELLNNQRSSRTVTPSTNTSTENPGTSHTSRNSRFLKMKKTADNSAQNSSNTLEKGIRVRRLMKEFGEIQKAQHRQESTFTAELVNDNLFEWYVRLHKIDPESKLAADMQELKIPHILLHMTFPEDFPFEPPFMKVISPRIEKGYVMDSGAICMELLTPRGWVSAYTIEALITQFAASLVKGQGRIARKPRKYEKRTAEESFRRLVKTHEKHGWVTPSLSEG